MWKMENCQIVFCNGCFDFGLTAPHCKLLNFAKSLGDKLIVALNDDDSCRRLKGTNRPILPLSERMYIVSCLACVDEVVSFKEDTPLELIKQLRPYIIVKGGDYQKQNVVGYGLAEIIIAPLYDGLSTTDKIKKYYEH